MARTLKIRVDASGITKAAHAAQNFAGKISNVASKLGAVTNGLFSLKSMFIGFIAIRAVSFFKDLFAELGKAEVAQRGLATAMKAGGNYTKESYDRLIEYGRALTKTTAFEDDAIIGAMRMLGTFKLNEQTMKDATIATLDLAAATGQDLQSAAILMGKAAVGETGMLKRYGIMVDEADMKSRGFAAVLDEVTKEFGGQAEMIRGTVQGKMMLLSNMWGDMKEQIAASIVESGAFAEMTKVVEQTIADVVEYVKANPRVFSSVFELGVAAGKSLITVTQALLPFFQYIVENKTVLMTIMGVMAGGKIGSAFGPWGAGIGAVAGGIGGGVWGATMPESKPVAAGASASNGTIGNVVGNLVQKGEAAPQYFAWE